MSAPDFERMTKEEIITWFDTAADISPLLARTTPAAEPVVRLGSDTPMMLASIRLPVALVEQLDGLAAAQGTRRSDIIRSALIAYVELQTTPVSPDEATRALDVFRRLVADRSVHPPAAA
jgi:hypothetical protein